MWPKSVISLLLELKASTVNFESTTKLTEFIWSSDWLEDRFNWLGYRIACHAVSVMHGTNQAFHPLQQGKLEKC